MLTNLTAAEQLQEGEQAEAAAVADSVAETEYWCLAAAAPGSETVVAVVCEEAGGGEVRVRHGCDVGEKIPEPHLACGGISGPPAEAGAVGPVRPLPCERSAAGDGRWERMVDGR